MTIPLVPYTGEMSYCLIKSLKMVLDYQGHVYPLGWLEVVSGEPFGFVYVRDKQRFFAVNGYVYQRAGEHLLRILNFAYTYTSSPDDATALASLEEALKVGPVAVGMLDMGYLSYIAGHQQLRGVDHAIVVLALQPDAVIVHDPEGYATMPLPLADFLEAWKRDVYTGKPYGLWRIGEQGQPPTEEKVWEKTLARARENFAWEAEEFSPGGPLLLYGPAAMRALAVDLRDWPQIDLGSLPRFSWRVSSQRCHASAIFLREKLPTASAIRWEESQLYGQLQHASVANARDALPVLLERLADLEEKFIAELG